MKKAHVFTGEGDELISPLVKAYAAIRRPEWIPSQLSPRDDCDSSPRRVAEVSLSIPKDDVYP
jgi:hypothetical protein